MSGRELDDTEEILRMVTFLGEVGYRDLSASAGRQRIAVSRRLWREGISERVLRMLWHYAESCGQTPVRLFCWWLDRPSRTIEKVNEMRERNLWAQKIADREVDRERETRRSEPAKIIDIKSRKSSS